MIQGILGRDFECIWKGDWTMREGRLGYNSSSERYGILLSDLWIDTGLHCGECLQILLDGRWVQTRMEMDAERNWYLVAHRIVVTWNIFRQGYNRAQTYRPKGRKAPGRVQGYF